MVFSHPGFPIDANAQASRTIHVAFKYEYFQQYGGTTNSWTYTGSADLTPVDGGYDGVGTGQYNEHDVYPAAEPCSSAHVTTANGKAELTVQARYSIDNHDTGGPDTSMYNSSTSVIELIYFAEGIPWQESPSVQGDKCIASTQGTYDVYGDCHFYEIDFSVGGTYQKADEDAPDSSSCSITITAVAEDLRIFGTVKGLFGSQGTEGLSNSRVVMAKLDDGAVEKLSTSKPNFSKKTATSDDDSAKYEFRFGREAGNLPTILVVSLLWYEGKPEFAVTNGKETAGRFIPVYQALCVDDNPDSKCEKWKETSNGYEAEVNFEYGSEDKLLENWQIMEPEEWMGINLQNSGGPPSSGTATYSSTGTTVMMADSAYMYYNSYRAMKYIETLGIQSPLEPLVIRSHDFDPGCGNGTAWYNHKYIDPALRRSFGDLGTFAEKVDATGGEVVMCDVRGTSSLHNPRAPDLPLWHEIGHYLQFQMYDPITNLRGTPHAGYYINPSSNDAFVEGFAGFVAMLIHKHYGLPFPEVYNSVNLELDTKIWGWDSGGQAEEEAVAGILWDFNDGGREINLGYDLNGTSVPVSRVYQASMDDVSLGAPQIIQVIDRNEIKTLVDLYSAFVSVRISAVNLDMIYVNHGVFADVEDRNFVHDSINEKTGQSGSKNTPVRLIRNTPPPDIPGSYIMSDADSTFNFTIKFDSPYGNYDYFYLREMKAGEKAYFRMPPEYYPSTLTITTTSTDGKPSKEMAEIESGQYWAYIKANPPKDGVFRQISAGGDVSAGQYIQNAKDFLSRASAEYEAGNYTGAEQLATMAYLDNFEHVEDDLDQRNATGLKEQAEQLMRVELIGLIREKAEPQVIDDKIAEINSKLDEAIVVVPEFPLAAIGIMIAAIGAVVIVGRLRLHIR